jgi:hypothetical protein
MKGGGILHFLPLGKQALAQLAEALRYKPENRGFDSRLSHWDFFINLNLLAALWPSGRLSL